MKMKLCIHCGNEVESHLVEVCLACVEDLQRILNEKQVHRDLSVFVVNNYNEYLHFLAVDEMMIPNQADRITAFATKKEFLL